MRKPSLAFASGQGVPEGTVLATAGADARASLGSFMALQVIENNKDRRCFENEEGRTRRRERALQPVEQTIPRGGPGRPLMNRRKHLLLALTALSIVIAAIAAAPGVARAVMGDDRELLANELQRTDAILEHVSESVRETNNPRLRDLFAQALKIQLMAKRIFEREGNTIDAQEKLRVLELTRRSRDMALRIQREVRKNVTYEEQARRLLEQSRVLLERIDEHDSEIRDRRVKTVLDKARDQLGASQRQFADGNFEVAFRLADSAHTLLRNLVQAARQRMSRQRLEGELERTDQLLERAHQRLDGAAGASARTLSQADQLQAKAHQALAREHEEQALKFTRHVRKLLRELLGSPQGLATHSDVQQALGRFDARLEKMRERNGDAIEGAAGRLVDQALASRERAVKSDAQGNYEAALQQLRAGLDLLNRAARLFGSASH